MFHLVPVEVILSNFINFETTATIFSNQQFPRCPPAGPHPPFPKSVPKCYPTPPLHPNSCDLGTTEYAGISSTPHSGGVPHPLRSSGKRSTKVNRASGPARSFSIVNPRGRQLKALCRQLRVVLQLMSKGPPLLRTFVQFWRGGG